jgi:hypothetical protein
VVAHPSGATVAAGPDYLNPFNKHALCLAVGGDNSSPTAPDDKAPAQSEHYLTCCSWHCGANFVEPTDRQALDRVAFEIVVLPAARALAVPPARPLSPHLARAPPVAG